MSVEGNLTFTIIKPNVVSQHKTGAVIQLIEERGFEIVEMKMIQLSKQKAEQFYAEHREKPFFDTLIDFMVSDKVVVMVVKKQNAITEFREFIGKTNPKEARKGSIRQLFGGDTVTENAIHGSDSVTSAEREINFFFKNLE